jgi:2'-5' RNA ligase
VPAHVTVLFPFRARDAIDEPTRQLVGEVAASVPAFSVRFAEPAEWPGVVWLRPEPDDGFRALTAAAMQCFPDYPPYNGEFPDTVPHLTVGQNLDDEQHRAAFEAMTQGLGRRPVNTEVRELVLYMSDDEGVWARRGGWPLR